MPRAIIIAAITALGTQANAFQLTCQMTGQSENVTDKKGTTHQRYGVTGFEVTADVDLNAKRIAMPNDNSGDIVTANGVEIRAIGHSANANLRSEITNTFVLNRVTGDLVWYWEYKFPDLYRILTTTYQCRPAAPKF